MATACLDPRLLSDYLAGRTVGPAVIAAVEDHLAQCAACQSRAAEHRPRSDSLYQALAQVATLKSASDEPELAVALSAIAGLKPAAEVAPPPPVQANGGKFIRDYQLLEKLAEGGMGAVYLAMHTWLDKPVAVKLLKSERNQDPQAVSRFEREMRAVGKLEHPHIVRALDAGQDEGIHFLVMEYVSGVDLSRLVQQLGPLAVADACELIRQAALGLHHAHESELIHRDVKPSNLMLASSGQLKVLDLGLAQFRASMWESLNLTADNQVLGTLLYISPEQLAAGGQVDRRSDIYSLGVTLCELLLGAEPLRRGLAPAVIFRAPPKPARRDVPEGVWSLVQRMVAHEKAHRPGTMHEVATLLANWTQNADLPRLARRLGSSAGIPVTASAGGSSAIRLPPQSHMPTAVTATTDVVPPPLPPSPPFVNTSSITALAVVHPAPPSVVPNRCLRLTTAGWIAAAIVGLVALTPAAWLVGKWIVPGRQPALTPQVAASGVLRIEPSDLAAEPLLADLVAQGDLLAMDENGKTTVLRAADNLLPPGKYVFRCQSREVVLADVSPIAVQAGEAVAMPRVSPGFASPWQVPLLPPPGSLCAYEGTLWHAGLPADQPKPFGLILATLGDEVLEGRPHRWLKVEVRDSGDAQRFSETAYLCVDVERWETAQEFAVRRGWIVAESTSIKDWLKQALPAAVYPGVVVDFDRHSDSLADIAGRHTGMDLPEYRLSIHDALALVFRAHVAASPWAMALRATMPPKRTFRLEPYPGPLGPVPSLHVSAHGPLEPAPQTPDLLSRLIQGPGQPKVALELWRSSQVHFGFCGIDARSEQFKASMRLSNSPPRNLGPASPPPVESLAEAAQRIGELSTPTLAFDRASLPKEDGQEVHYIGTVTLDKQALNYDAWVRTVGTERRGDDSYRWLEIEVISDVGGSKHHELAKILVNESRYVREETLTPERGWLKYSDEVFPFDLEGDIKQVQTGLARLGAPIPERRFGVHDVLALMFNARLRASAKFSSLRPLISSQITKAGIDRVQKVQTFPRKKGPKVRGHVYELPPQEEMKYLMRRSSEIPFDFQCVKMALEIKGVVSMSLTAEEDGVRHDAVSKLPSELESDKLAAATQQRIDETYGANWRRWSIAADPPKVLWAEYCGTRKGTTIVLLRDEDQQFREVALAQLSHEDQLHAKAGRYWTNSSGRPVKFKNDPASDGVRGEFVKLTPSYVKLRRSSDSVEDFAAVDGKYISLRDFSDDDQAAIDELWTPTAVIRRASTPAGRAKVGSPPPAPMRAAAAGRPASAAPAARPARRSVFESIGSAVTGGFQKAIMGSPADK